MKKEINILGCGLMGTQIASLFSLIGYEVNVWNRKKINLNNLVRYKKFITKTLKIDDLGGPINFINKLEDLKDNITLESLIEDLEIKKNILSKIDKNIKKEIFTNTSSIQIHKINKRLNLLHFFNPISLKIAEINKNNVKSDEAHLIFEDLKKIGFELIEVRDFTGFAFNKILFAEISNFFFLIEKEGVKKESLLNLYKRIYSNLNILNTIDIIGVDTTIKIFENLNKEYNNFYIPNFLNLCLKKKILGKKNKSTIKLFFDSPEYPGKLND